MDEYEAMDVDVEATEFFCCTLCHSQKPLQELLDLDCSCLVCSCCGAEHVAPKLVPVRPAPVHQDNVYLEGQVVRYRQRNGELISAKVMQVDRSIQPYGYGIKLEGATEIRFTEATRLLPQEPDHQVPSAWLEQGAL